MAYQGGYGGGGGAQRSYGGSSMRQPGPHGYGEPPAQRQYGAQEQSYQDRQDGYGYGDQYQSNGYAQNPPAQDYYGQGQGPNPARGGGPMPPYARGGGPIARPGTADGHRGGYGAPRGRGMPPGPGRGMPGGGGGGRPGQYPQGDYGARRPPPNQRDPGYGAYDQDNQLSGQMSGMNLNGQRQGGRADGRSSFEHDGYGRPVDGGRGAPQGYADPRQGPPAGQAAGGYGGYDDGHAQQGGMRNEFGPPGRSMTMPNYDAGGSQEMPAPRRVDTMPYGDAVGRNQPQRPATANSQRPPPQRIYPSDRPVPQRGQHGGGYGDNSQGYGGNGAPAPAAPAGVDDVYDSYYESPRGSGSDHHNNNQQNQAQAPQPGYGDFNNPSGGYGQPSQPGTEQPQSGAHQTPRLHHAKSEANFHEPQAAVFEMAGDIPSVPPMPAGSGAPGQAKPYQPDFNHGYGASPAGYDQLPPRGPSAPPGSVHDFRPGGGGPNASNNAAVSRHNPSASNPDGLPSHPTPVRPGLMANSIVNLNDRPPPVRNYGGVPQSGYAQPQAQQHSQHQMQSQQQHAPPPPQQQQQQQPPPGQGGASYQAVPAPQIDDPVTAQELEQLRQVIKSNPNDQQSAFRLAKRLIEAADVLAPKLPEPKQRARARERYLLDAHKILKKLSQAQNMDAMFTFADSIGKGLFGHEPDSKEAFTLYQSAAKLGHAAAAYRTAVCCEIGHEEGGGTRKDPLKAMQWYKRAATLGDPPAMYKVGMILLKGLLGQQRNPREAVGWLKRASERADSENPHALHELGLLYESAQPNDAIIRDERYALSLFQDAADLGYKFSQYRLGHAFENAALGCPNDPRQSIFWYSKAATQEEHQSELALSGWYLTGSPGVLSQSDTEAYLWARKAAVAGLAKAEYAMGYFTEVGIGVPPNLEDAKRWYWRAAAQDFPKARERLEQLKRVGKSHPPRQRERISRGRIERQQDGDCTIM